MTEQNENWAMVFYDGKKPVSSTFVNADKNTVSDITNWLVNNQEKMPMLAFKFDQIGYIRCFDFIPVGKAMLEQIERSDSDENS